MRLPNGYGSIINLGKKRRKPFAVRVTAGYEKQELVNGVMRYKQKYKYIGYFEKRQEALKFLSAYNEKPHLLDNRDLTFNDIYSAWSKRKYENITERTAKNYISIYNHFEPLHNMAFSAIKTHHLQEIIDKHKTNSTIKHFKSFINMLYEYGIKNEIIEKNYANYLEMPKTEIKKPKVPFTQKEINTLWKHKDDKFINYILIQLYTGARITELLEVTLDNVNMKERSIFIAKSKTPAGIRHIPIHKDILSFVAESVKNNNNYLFERNNKRISYQYYIKHIFKPIMEYLKMEHTPHETRHTFISQCDRLELNETAVARIIGHSNNNITKHYTHKDINDLKEVIDSFKY